MSYRLEQLAKGLHQAFAEEELTLEKKLKTPFIPHLTLWKTSRNPKKLLRFNKGKQKNTELMQQALVEMMQQKRETNPLELDFGMETPISIELLSMLEKEEDGKFDCFYLDLSGS
jgi:hypothetical protein